MKKLFRKLLFWALSAGLFLSVLAPSAKATETGAPTEAGAAKTKYIYERPNRQKFSQLFWALDVFDINDDQNIDNFLIINDCDIYKDYKNNEFEWKNVQKSAREFLAESKSQFPLRFELVQPLFLGEYDVEKKHFNIVDDYKIKARTRFEVLPGDHAERLCNDLVPSENYPAGLVAEINRPIDMTVLEVPVDVAKAYIEEKTRIFNALGDSYKTRYAIINQRDAYIFTQIKFLAYKKSYVDSSWLTMVELMAILENIEIYADRDKKFLLWSQDFRKKPSKKRAMIKEAPLTPANTVTEKPAAVKPEEAEQEPVPQEEVVPFSPLAPSMQKTIITPTEPQ